MELLVRPAPTDLYRRLDSARALMETSYGLPLELSELASAAHFSKFHFLRSFRATFHLTPHQYLTEIRLRTVKSLLKRSELPITEICFEAGFESLGSFSSMFRRYFGEAPSVYRRRHQKLYRLALEVPEIAVPSCFLDMFLSPPAK